MNSAWLVVEIPSLMLPRRGWKFSTSKPHEGGVRSLFFPIRSVSWGISANPHGSFFWPLNISLRLLMILATSDGLWGLCVICWSISGCSYGFQKLVLWEKLQHNLIKRRNIHNKKWLLRSRHFWYHLLSFPSMIPRWREVKSMLPGSSSVSNACRLKMTTRWSLAVRQVTSILLVKECHGHYGHQHGHIGNPSLTTVTTTPREMTILTWDLQ